MKEKETKEPEFDAKDDTSFQDKYMMVKAMIFTGLICFSGYYINKKMQQRVADRKARVQGYVSDRNQIYPNMVKDDQIGGHWQLLDCSGQLFTSYDLEGNYYVLYFGFSLCPDVCPISLMKLSKAVRKVNRSKEGQQLFQLKEVFVTVNPDVDTNEKLREYCNLFDNELIGLRGSTALDHNLQQMLKVFKVPAGLTDEERTLIKDYFDQKQQQLYKNQSGRKFKIKTSKFLDKFKFWKSNESFDNATSGVGTMNDHSKVFYLMAPDNQCIGFYDLEIDNDELAERMLEDISFDIGVGNIGSGLARPENLANNQ